MTHFFRKGGAMSKILVVGSTTVDIVLEVDRLPAREEDVLIRNRTMALGGCAFNAASALRALGEPHELFCPVGSGPFGAFVRERFAELGVATRIPPVGEENGCCYCLVEPCGERTFIALHGAEYSFEAAWFDALDLREYDMVYVCGFEIEHRTGAVVVDFLERCAEAARVFFAPGTRVAALPVPLVERILDLHPLLHVNSAEALAAAERYLGAGPADERAAARLLCARTSAPVITTLGAAGCWYETGVERGLVPGVSARVVDTIGAGDAHAGATMGCLHRGLSLPEALARANRVAAAVVGVKGATLPEGAFDGSEL